MLAQLLVEITRKPRHKVRAGVDFEWSNKSWTHNCFRAFELVFGAPYGIRPSIASWKDKEGVEHQVGYTLEAQLAIIETYVRALFKKYSFKLVLVPQMQLAGMGNMGVTPYMFAIAFDAVSGGTVIASLGHTCTGSNLVFVGYAIGDNTDTVTDDTYAGASMFPAAVKLPYTGDRWNYFFVKTAPATGANTQVLSGSVFKELAGLSYTGCAQSGQPDATFSNFFSVAGTTSVATLTVVANQSWLIGCSYAPGGYGTSGGSSLRGDTTTTGVAQFDSNAAVGTGSQTVTITNASNPRLVLGLSIAPVAAAGGTVVYLPQLLTLNVG